jgi:hypothetical protein
MEKILLVLLLGAIAAGTPEKAIAADNGAGQPVAGQAPLFAPPALYGAEVRPQALFLAPPSATIAPVWRERNEWERRRADQWGQLEWQRQQWRENRGEPAGGNQIHTSATQGPASSSSF